MKLIGHCLEALTVVAERRCSLDGVANLGVEGVDASVGVVLEETTKSSPESGCGRGLAEDKIEDLGRHARVDPLDDGEIIFDPARIIEARNGVGGDVGAQIAAAKVYVEEVAPMVVIVGCKV